MSSTANPLDVSYVSPISSANTTVSKNTFDDIALDSNLNRSSEQYLTNENEFVTAAKNPNPNPIFSDPAVVVDFNGDGKTDKFWRNEQTGENATWIMDGTNVTSAAFLPTTESTWDYSIVDFNNDGKNDIFWRNRVTGENAAWFMDGTDATGFNITEIETSWNPTFGDFNGDSRTDILWSNKDSGENSVWITNGTLFNDVLFNEATLPQLSSSWEANIGDFNADGKTDVFWHNNQTGENTAWLMDGGEVSTKAFLPSNDLAWEPMIGDYTGDGRTDVFWNNTQTGENAIWIMNGTIAEGEYLPTFEPDWNVF